MNSAIMTVDEPEFFAPSNSDAIDTLIGQYERAKTNIDEVAAFMSGPEMQAASQYFFDAQRESLRGTMPSVERTFDPEGATKALDAQFWDRALKLTDVIDYMPDAKRRDWFDQIRQMKCPPFDEATVRDNLERLLAQRMDFLSEMVDGIFIGLSGEHVTNRPEGFSKRMIINAVYSEWGMPGRKEGLIQDFRSVIAKFMGRDQPHYNESHVMLMRVREVTGEWHTVDGGAFRIRVYKKGTAHIEVHPDIAWRLNQVLAHRYPMAIPPAHRQRPKKQPKNVTLFDRPLPFAVLDEIARGTFWTSEQRTRDGVLLHSANEFSFSVADCDKHVRQAAAKVLEAIGATHRARGNYLFDYDAREVINEIVISGMVPDQKSYQFYPTPERLAREVIERAEIKGGDRCLEPSAGQGAIADLMPPDTICVEASELHCRVLESKGRETCCANFLERRWGQFDRICMNPPFSIGRAQAHVEHAASMLAPGGRLVAIMPASYAGKGVLPLSFDVEWSPVYDNEFAGTSISVVILTAEVTHG